MFLHPWIRFTWDLKRLPKYEPPPSLSAKVRMTGASDDLQQIYDAVERSYKTDAGWNNGLEERVAQVKAFLFQSGKRDEAVKPVCFLMTDGKRITGVSALNTKTAPHFVTGVCVSEEYRCRGYGTVLLHASLKHLADLELEEASVITRSKIIAARYLYPKFGSQSQPLTENKPENEKKQKITYKSPKALDDLPILPAPSVPLEHASPVLSSKL